MKTKLIAWGLAAILLAAAAGYLVLINPDNPLTRAFQRQISDVDSRIVVGPYPVERDFRILEDADVGLIVSLLDPAIPYEKTLLERERRLAAAHGMRLRNFPMTSILGRKFGGYYATSAADAAAAIAGTSDKVYLHCYLGLHRIQPVRAILAAQGVMAQKYTLRRAVGERSRNLFEAADSAYHEQRYEEALAQLAQIKLEELSPEARLLKGWSHFQLGHYDVAAAQFAALRHTSPNLAAAAVGAGYTALREGRTRAAAVEFGAALRLAPDSPEAIGGLGLVQLRAGRTDLAERSLERALELAPTNPEFRDALSQLRRKP